MSYICTNCNRVENECICMREAMHDLKLEIARLERICQRLEHKLTETETENSRFRDALKKIVGYHGEDECGFCGSFRTAKEALASPPKEEVIKNDD